MSRNKPHAKLCGAKTRSGKPCKNPAMTNGRCRMHGGKSTGPKTPEGKGKVAANAIKHGGYVDRLLNEDEKQVYDALWNYTIEKYSLDQDNPVYMAMLHRACMSYIKTLRLDEWEMEEKFECELDDGGNPIPKPVIDKDGLPTGELQFGEIRRLRWPQKAPAWESHFQKYIQMLGTDRASEIRQKQAQKAAGSVADAFGWLFNVASGGE